MSKKHALNVRLNCLIWNVQSLNKKTFEILSYLEDNSIDILFATETWMKDVNNVQTSSVLITIFSMLFAPPIPGVVVSES